jgi:DegV family protein with EDD domain
MRIGLVTDSVSDIPQHLIDQYAIEVVPTTVVMDGQSYLDDAEITRADFYARMPNLKAAPTTAAPSPAAFSQRFKASLDNGHDHILCILTAETLSGIYNAAMLAAQDFGDRITVVDSQSLSLGIGFQVISAAQALEKGGDLDRAFSAIRMVQERLHIVAFMETLENLRRSGRVGFLSAGIGNLLNVKLFLQVKAGSVERLESQRSRARAIARLIEMIDALGPFEYLGILHANAEEDAHAILEQTNAQVEHPPIVQSVTPSMGVHVGPQALGFAGVRAQL